MGPTPRRRDARRRRDHRHNGRRRSQRRPMGGYGTVFFLTPPATSRESWNEAVYSLTGSIGEQPNAGVTLGADGAIYGTTMPGSTVFEMTPPETAGGQLTVEVLAAGGPILTYPCRVLASDTWLWNGVNWTQTHPATSPVACSAAGIAYDAVGESMICSRGSAPIRATTPGFSLRLQSPEPTKGNGGRNETNREPGMEPLGPGSFRHPPRRLEQRPQWPMTLVWGGRDIWRRL
jgi:hypothetical protein